MFWPTVDESVNVNSGAKTHNIFQASMFGMKPVLPDLSVLADDAQKIKLVSAVTEVTSHLAHQAFKMAANLNLSGAVLQKLGSQPVAAEVALWKHHGSVG